MRVHETRDQAQALPLDALHWELSSKRRRSLSNPEHLATTDQQRCASALVRGVQLHILDELQHARLVYALCVILALFDLDNTLLDADSDVEWGHVLASVGAMDAARIDAYHEQYQAGSLDIHEFLEFQLAPLQREDPKRLLEWRERFLATRILHRIPASSHALVERHRQAGHRMILITATNSFLAAPLAALFGIPELLASEPQQRAGRYTGKLDGLPCFREGKLLKLQAHLAPQRLEDCERSYFYSDSHNDLPLLAAVTDPIAVRPDPRLRLEAQRRGWTILD